MGEERVSCIVIVDMREGNGQIVAITDGQSLARFASRAEAESFMSGHILGRFRHFVIDLDMMDEYDKEEA